MKRSLAGRVAVVTGASSGIGLAIARALARAGARLVLVSRSETGLEAAARHVASDGAAGSTCLTIPCDVSDAVAVRAMASRVLEEAGPPDIVINNAGIGVWAPVAETPVERIRQVFDVNFFGAVHCTHAFLPANAGAPQRADRLRPLGLRLAPVPAPGGLLGEQARDRRVRGIPARRGRGARRRRAPGGAGRHEHAVLRAKRISRRRAVALSPSAAGVARMGGAAHPPGVHPAAPARRDRADPRPPAPAWRRGSG